MAEEKYGVIDLIETGIRSSNPLLMAIIKIASEEESRKIMLETGAGRRLLTSTEADEIQKVLDNKVPYYLNHSHSPSN